MSSCVSSSQPSGDTRFSRGSSEARPKSASRSATPKPVARSPCGKRVDTPGLAGGPVPSRGLPVAPPSPSVLGAGVRAPGLGTHKRTGCSWLQPSRGQGQGVGRGPQLAGQKAGALTACTGAAMSRWTHTPGQSKPMCEAIKRPAQELGLLSRSCKARRVHGDFRSQQRAGACPAHTPSLPAQPYRLPRSLGRWEVQGSRLRLQKLGPGGRGNSRPDGE